MIYMGDTVQEKPQNKKGERMTLRIITVILFISITAMTASADPATKHKNCRTQVVPKERGEKYRVKTCDVWRQCKSKTCHSPWVFDKAKVVVEKKPVDPYYIKIDRCGMFYTKVLPTKARTFRLYVPPTGGRLLLLRSRQPFYYGTNKATTTKRDLFLGKAYVIKLDLYSSANAKEMPKIKGQRSYVFQIKLRATKRGQKINLSTLRLLQIGK